VSLQDDSENESLDSDRSNSQDSKTSPLQPATTPGAKAGKKGAGAGTGQDWEILEGLRDGQTCTDKPDKYEGYMMKRRKWPLKGWHKVRGVALFILVILVIVC
jgi:hypothetical protein